MELHPRQFVVNDTWILFQLSKKPVMTNDRGPAVCFGLMDAASCYILCGQFFPGTGPEVLTKENVHALLTEAWALKNAFPTSLFVPPELVNAEVEALAELLGIQIISVPESDLSIFLKEAQDGFRERFD